MLCSSSEDDADEQDGSLLAALFLLNEPLQCASWRPPLLLSGDDVKDAAGPDDLLAFCTTAGGLFLWSALTGNDRGAVRLPLHSPLPAAASLHWAGENLLVRGKDSFILVPSSAISTALFAPERQPAVIDDSVSNKADSLETSDLS